MIDPNRPNKVGKQRSSYSTNAPGLAGFNYNAWRDVTLAGDKARSDAYINHYAQKVGTSPDVIRGALFKPGGGLRDD